jgi:cytochrome c556
MSKKFFLASLALAVGIVYSMGAFAQVKPEVLVKQRQAAMTLQGKYWGPLGGMVAGRVPYNAAVVARNAGYLEVLTKLPWDGFDPSTSGVKSGALPAVYSDPAKFKQAGENLEKAVGNLVVATKGSDEAAIKAAMAPVGKACGACHDDFREKPPQ